MESSIRAVNDTDHDLSRGVLRDRIAELDGLRALAVLGVLIWHLTGSMAPRDDSYLAEILMRGTVFGRTGVDLFFILSGYLIIGILIDQRESPNLFKVFYIRRLFRIWPPYLVLVALYWLGYWLQGESEAFNTRHGWLTQLAAQLSFNWNTLMALTDSGVSRGFSVTWSVAIEEWFYVFIPLLIVLLPRSRLWAMLITLSLASALARAAFSLTWPDIWLAPYVLLPFRLDGLCIGGLVAIVHRSSTARAWLTSRKADILQFTAIALAINVAMVVLSLSDLDATMYRAGHLILSLTYGLIVLTCVVFSGDVAFGFLRAGWLKRVSLISYTLYLVHPLFLSAAFQIAGRKEILASLQDIMLMLTALTVSLIFSALSFALIEKRAIAFSHRFRY